MNRTIDYAFVHGGGQGSWVWAETIAAMQCQAPEHIIRTVALDVPGCGSKRERATGELSFSDIVDELIDDIEAAQLKDVVLVGHSQAGTVLPALAARRPDLFRRLIYVSCPLPVPGQTLIDMIGDDVHGAREDRVGWPVDPKTTSMQERTRIMFCNDMTPEQADNLMGKLGRDQWPASSYVETNWDFGGLDQVPSSYVICLQDNILPVTWQATFARRFHAERVVRVDAGHQVMNTRPYALAEIIRLEGDR